tara:strand:- start:403 stop:585 length:183 start_codon:yes stop_codon:yes gene_type:complete
MSDFLEIDEEKKSIKKLNLDDLSVDELKEYINILQTEITRVSKEIDSKVVSKKNAEKIFK